MISQTRTSSSPLRALAALSLLITVGLAGCGGGAQTTSTPETGRDVSSSYTGPAAATADVQAFRTSLWEPLRASNRCGSCHGVGGELPNFVRTDDVNAAYAQASTVVNRNTPGDSLLVTKVAGGHNCWEASAGACGAVLTAYITAWVGGGADGGATEVTLDPPPNRDPGASKTLPDDPSGFIPVHNLLTAHCSACHASTGATPQSPYFASSDLATAYEAVRGKIDLDNPGNSRLVVRLRNESHNCWSDDCADDANEMEQAITTFADGVPTTAIDPVLVVSKALRLFDGVVASAGGRYENNLIAKYEFKTGTGSIAYDTSGVDPALNLNLSGAYEWVGGWGIDLKGGKAQGSTSNSRKLADHIKATGEYSVEAWVVPGNVTQEGPARIVSYSAGTGARNFTLGQTQYSYEFLGRSSATDGNGMPTLATPDAEQDLQATQQHVVITFDPVNGRRIYVNGVSTDDVDPEGGGSLSSWDDTFALVFGNEASNDRPWQGKLRLVAIYNRALNQAQIAQNFGVGVGEKYFLLFNVSELVEEPQSYFMFEVSQFDSYSYLFNRPTFISLENDAQPDSIVVKGMRIGINGREALVGQAYRKLDTTVGGSSYTDAGQVISTLGAVIASESGPDSDEFFLTFEQLGSHTNVTVEASTTVPPPAADLPPAPDVGVRTFDEINATMSAVTGVPTTESAVRTTYTTLKQQLPTVENIEGFLSSHQVGVSQLAVEYCNALVGDTTRRAAYFPGVNFGAAAGSAFDTVAERNLVIDPLLNRVVGTGLATQPAAADVRTELDGLIVGLTACGGGCDAGRTATVVIATCAATLGSAAMLLQ